MVIILEMNFKFTIITTYNTEKYLRSSIESVINQDIDFEDNVQYILVNDESDDNSKDIALEYRKLYPHNISALSKENGSDGSAHNLRLNYIEGEFVNFLDSGDYLSLNTMSVIDEFEKVIDEKYLESITFCKSIYDVISGCDTLILITEWKEFRNPDFNLLSQKLNQKIIFDGRNIYDNKITTPGFELFQIGC